MGMTFTREQQQVIDLRNRNLLVAAAAGSGKTAVLVERIISKVTDDKHPLDIDKLLIVTFTNAAASEMRERIGMALEQRLEENPQDEHLQRQQTLLYNAQITTIHSFCLFVIRNYFHSIDLEPDFRIGEEGELKLLQEQVLGEVLEGYYEKNSQAFMDLTETIATGKNDDKLKETILTLYHFAMSDPWPGEWLSGCIAPYQAKNLTEFEKLPMYKGMLDYFHAVTTQWLDILVKCEELSREENGPQTYTECLTQERERMEKLFPCDSYEEYQDAITKLEFGRLPSVRNFKGDEKKKDFVQAMRKDIKDSKKKLMDQFFFLPAEDMVENLQNNVTVVGMLIQVTQDFMSAYGEKKREKNMLDFNDLEHLALEILVDAKTKEPSMIARELRNQFEEIMIDEYQDSNLVQETILQSVSKGANLFMVGDVKQSIYRFRMARPELFMEKYNSYTDSDSENQKIDLHKNFRSRKQVLKTVNDIFYCIMAKDLGNVEYDKQAALYPGMDFPEGENPQLFQTEVLLADPNEFAEAEEIQDVEAVMIAAKIKELMKEQLVTDKGTGELRPMEYGDVVILLRGIGAYGQRLTEVLKEHGIPAVAATGTGYFSAIEVQTILNLLRLIDNPRQDIPMAAVLQSYIGGLTAEEMAKIRIFQRKGPFYEGVFSYAAEGPESALREKLVGFLTKLGDFRNRVCDTPIHELLYQVMDETGYMDYVYALPGGTVRRGNLEMLLERAISYEKTSYHGLFHFIRYVNQLNKYQVDFGLAEEGVEKQAVRIMTIHKSKGLEFPVVFVSNMGKLLNQQDVRNRMVLHPQYGIGLDITDLERRVRIPALTRQILVRQIQMENAGEELRVLYVALTRAREKLILTGTMKKAKAKLEGMRYNEMDEKGHMGFLKRLNATCYLDWVLPALMWQGGYQIQLVTPLELATEQVEQEVENHWSREWILEEAQRPDPKLAKEIERRLSYCYPYQKEQGLKTKLSVSELKHRAMEQLKEEGDGEPLFQESQMLPYIPEFMEPLMKEKQGENMGALRGTAMHRVLECFDFAKDFATLPQQLQEMHVQGRIEDSLFELVSPQAVEEFFRSELAIRMQQAARNGKLYKEKPFVMGKAANEISPETDSQEMILIQGIIDAFFEEEGALVLVDYKTDAVKAEEELKNRYQEQMNLYQEALIRATRKPVKEKWLYSFKLKKEIGV